MMTGPVATCAGSSGGAQPPPDPHRLPSQCESAPPAARGRGRGRRPRKGRGPAKGEHKFKSFHGRRSYAQHREKKANTETQVPQSPIDNWRDMHLREGTWANDLTEETYNMMQQELQAQLGPSDSGSGSASVDQLPIMQRVLGRHRGHIPGVSPTLPQSSQQAASRLSSVQRAAYEDRIQRIEASHQQLMASHQQLTDAVRQLTDVVRQLAPNIRLPSSDAPPSSSSGCK